MRGIEAKKAVCVGGRKYDRGYDTDKPPRRLKPIVHHLFHIQDEFLPAKVTLSDSVMQSPYENQGFSRGTTRAENESSGFPGSSSSSVKSKKRKEIPTRRDRPATTMPLLETDT